MTRMTEPTAKSQTATTGTTGSTTTTHAPIELTELDKLRIQMDARRAVCGRRLRCF
jgi:hypothetical protein